MNNQFNQLKQQQEDQERQRQKEVEELRVKGEETAKRLQEQREAEAKAAQ